MRLFLLSLVLWGLSKLWREHTDPAVFWTANLVVALLFGASHLPAAVLTVPLTVSLILYVFVLNGVASMVFGYLFWRSGLEAAMVAHFFADLILQVIAPMVLA
jgi:membrane protease YdiL (CAAX protease family)